MNKKVYDVYYADGRTALVIEADLDQGWTKLQKTYGYFKQTRIPYRGDLTIRAQMTVIAQPAGFAQWASSFPDVELDEIGGYCSYTLRQKRLILKVPFSPDQPWRTTKPGRPEIFVEQLPC